MEQLQGKSVLQRNGLYRKYLMIKERGLVAASCVFSSSANFLFTSFEYAGELTLNESRRSIGTSLTGSYAYDLSGGNNLTVTGLDASINYTVLVWVYNGATCTVNSTAAVNNLRTLDGWQLRRFTFSANSICTIAGSGLIDHLMIIPENAAFEGNVYDDAYHITARTDNKGNITFYEYDNMGRLKIIRDFDKKIIKAFDYQYKTSLNQ